MAQITFDQVSQPGENENQVGFFNLKTDNEEAVVRFMVDSVDDLEILTVHSLQVDGKYRKVSCLRSPRDPIENCPLCASGDDVRQVVYIPMMKYTNTQNGIQAEPVVWERNASTYAYKIKGYLDNYGPLSNILCKVIRHGKSGDLKTTYDIIPNLSTQQYPPQSFVPNFEAFSEYKALGGVVMDKHFHEVEYFMNYGTFPEKEDTQVTPQPQPPISNSQNQTYQEINEQPPQQYQPQHSQPPQQYQPQPEVGTGFPEQQPQQPVEQPSMGRPVRHY